MSVLRIFFRILFWCIPPNSKFVQAFPTVNFPYFIWCCTTYSLRTYTHRGKNVWERENMYSTDMPSILAAHRNCACVLKRNKNTQPHIRIVFVTHTHYQKLWNLQTHTRIGNLIELNWTESRKRRKKCAREIISVECFAEFFFLLLFSRSQFNLLLFLFFFLLFLTHLFCTWCAPSIRIKIGVFLLTLSKKLNEW